MTDKIRVDGAQITGALQNFNANIAEIENVLSRLSSTVANSDKLSGISYETVKQSIETLVGEQRLSTSHYLMALDVMKCYVNDMVNTESMCGRGFNVEI